MTKSELKARYAEIVTETASLEVERDLILNGTDKTGGYTYPEQDADYAANCAKYRSLTKERHQVLDAMDNE